MVKITDTSLIIEIPTEHEAPLVKLANMQAGLLELVSLVDHEGAGREAQNGLFALKALLQEMLLSPGQLIRITQLAKTDSALMNSFQ
ncbi:hypothetical protein [Paraflavitalea speifideaquila]|uniref:hypothetical protein n=1 Tax=Paraflavitalea speifideaquila TaxID=3076558 RepID=UPI0028E83739|nr:hypothetical protein [Paraflavitalea speifideiaquila]